MPLVYILAIFVAMSFQLNDAGDCSNNPRGMMGDDEYCIFCAEVHASDKHDCSKYYNADNPKSHQLVFDSEESGGCALTEGGVRIGVRIKCQSIRTYYYISAHGTIMVPWDSSDEEIIPPPKNKVWSFNSHLITFTCPGKTIGYDESDNIQRLLEAGKIEQALASKGHEYKKNDPIHEFVFYFNKEFPATGGIHELTTDAKGRVKNINLLYDFIPKMEYEAVELIEAAEILDKKGLRPGTIFWLACSKYANPEDIVKMSELPRGPRTTMEIEQRRNEIFNTLKTKDYDPLLDKVKHLQLEWIKRLNAAIGGHDKTTNEKYQYAKKEYIDPTQKTLNQIHKKAVDYWNIGWYYQWLIDAKEHFSDFAAAFEMNLGWVQDSVKTGSAKQEYAASYYDYGGDIGYDINDEYDLIFFSRKGAKLHSKNERILRKMRKQKKHHSQNHH